MEKGEVTKLRTPHNSYAIYMLSKHLLINSMENSSVIL